MLLELREDRDQIYGRAKRAVPTDRWTRLALQHRTPGYRVWRGTGKVTYVSFILSAFLKVHLEEFFRNSSPWLPKSSGNYLNTQSPLYYWTPSSPRELAKKGARREDSLALALVHRGKGIGHSGFLFCGLGKP